MQGMLAIAAATVQILEPNPLGLARRNTPHAIQKRSMAIETGRNPFMKGIGGSDI